MLEEPVAHDSQYLIVGLGNPGAEHDHTRHNIGFDAVRSFAKLKGLSLKKDRDLKGEVVRGEIGGKKVFLLLPMTYMNNSGESVRRCIDYYKIRVDQILVVCDDIALPLGTLRIRAQGSAGGHNGLKSIEAHLGTQYYARFRLGIGSPQGEPLVDHVLGRFVPQEEKMVEEVVSKAQGVLDLWVMQGIAAAMQVANARTTE